MHAEKSIHRLGLQSTNNKENSTIKLKQLQLIKKYITIQIAKQANLFNISDPVLDILKRFVIGNIINEHDSLKIDK